MHESDKQLFRRVVKFVLEQKEKTARSCKIKTTYATSSSDTFLALMKSINTYMILQFRGLWETTNFLQECL